MLLLFYLIRFPLHVYRWVSGPSADFWSSFLVSLPSLRYSTLEILAASLSWSSDVCLFNKAKLVDSFLVTYTYATTSWSYPGQKA